MTKLSSALSALLLSGSGMLFGAAIAPHNAHAAAPQVRTQAPGFYRVLLGDIEITALSDGSVTIPLDQLLTNTTPDHVRTVLAGHHLAAQVETSINAYLVNTGKHLVLIDAGAGTSFGKHAGGQLVHSIRAAGYKPEDIDGVFLTHIHGDHSNGLTVDGKAVFENAEVYVEERDAAFWLDPETKARVVKDHTYMVDEALVAFAPYQAAGKVRTFHAGAAVLPGIRSVPAPGHTPGHTVYEVTGDGQTMRFIGDLLHAKDVQMAEPQVTIRFDEDAKAARAQREAFFAAAAARGTIVAASHTPFPGVGRIARNARAYIWAPLNYNALQ